MGRRRKDRDPDPSGPVIDSLSVVLVDDHPLVLDGLVTTLRMHRDIVIAGSCRDGRSALDLLDHVAADVVVVADTLPDLTAVEFVHAGRRAAPKARFVVLARSKDPADVLRALMAGADGYVLDDVTGSGVATAVRAVAQLGCYLDPRAARVVVAALRDQEPDEYELTARELQMLRLAADGLTNAAIAVRVHMSLSTVKSYLRSACHKLGARNRTEAVQIAMRRGLL